MTTPSSPSPNAGQLELLWRRLKNNAAPAQGGADARRVQPADRGQPMPLSFPQQRLWFMDQLDHAAGQAYHMPLALRLTGPLDSSALQAALDAIVARHESLRTTFVAHEGATVQCIAAPGNGLDLRERDLSALTEDERATQLTTICAEEVAAPFDLATGPLIRGQLLHLASDEHVLLITQHHIVSDGWSVSVLVQEVCALYAAFSNGAPNPLAPLAIQYPDYALWQRGWLHGEVLQEQIAFWKLYLGGAPALLELPADHPRPAVQSYAGAGLPFTIDAELTGALRALGQRHGTTLFMTLLAAWSVLLARISGQDDIVVGTPVANRQQSACEGLIGLFVNTLALRVRVDQDPTVAQLLAQVRHDTLAAYAHQDLPFEQVVEALQPTRSLSHSPLFQVMLSMNNTIGGDAGGPQSLSGLTVARIEHEQNTTQFDLSVSFSEAPDALHGRFEYASDLFDPARIERLASQFRTLLASMAADDQQQVSRLALLNDDERRQVLVEFNDNVLDYPRDQLIQHAFEEQARLRPDADAVVHEHRSLTYAQLNARANQLAHCLIEMGVAADDRVAVCVERGTDMVVAMLGVLKAGAAYVPLDPGYPAERLAFALGDSAPVVLVAHAGLRHLLPHVGIPVVDLDTDGARLAAQPAHDPDPAALGLKATNLAYVIYTSGSTGQPKGVMIAHRSVVNFVHAHVQVCALTPADRVLQFAAFGFDVHAGEIFPALSIGATVVIRPARIVAPDAAFIELLQVHAVTVSDLPSAFWHQWTQDIVRDGAAPRTALRLIIAGGEKVEHRHLLSWHSAPGLEGCRWLNTYGPTEATVTMTAVGYDAGDALPPHEVPIGRPVANTRVYILDRHMQPVPVGVAGEMYLGGDCVARGYLNRPALNEERFLPDPFCSAPDARMYRSGDLARWWSDGNIEYLGRNDFQVKLRGFRIELGEIETRLFACAGVRDAVVAVREDKPGDKRLVAYLLADAGVQLAPAALREALAAVLPDYMVPGAYVTLDAFPLTINGKLDRPALPVPGDAALITRNYEAPEGDTEIVLAAIWQELLGVKQAGRHDHFFELGGHSLLAVQVVSRVRQALGVEVPLRDLFGEPTLGGFARAINAAGRSDLSAIEAADRDAPLALSYAQQRLWFLQELDQAASAAYHIPVGLRLHGCLHTGALQAALDRIVARHEALRTVFVDVGGRPQQRILPASGFAVTTTDLGALPMPQREAALAAATAAEAAAPFDLAQGPLIRGQLLRMADDDHILLITQHHIVSDGWSINLLVREFSTLYTAFCAGRDDPLAPLAIQYADFAAWQRGWLQGALLQGQIDFWAKHLGGAPALLALPTDRPRPALQSYAGASHALQLGEQLSAGLRALSQRHGTTLFMTLLAGWSVLLARLSGQQDVVIGTPVANRQRSEIESLIGFFVNTLALRVRLEDNPSVAALLAQVKASTLGAYEHQDLPFEQVVEMLQPVRSMGHSPIFQVMLSMDAASADDTLHLPGLTLHPVAATHKTTHFDMNLALSDVGGDIIGNLEYASDLFDAATAARFAGHFKTLLGAMVANDQLGVAQLPLLGVEERSAIVAAGASRAAFDGGDLVHQRFARHAATHGDAIALVCDGVTVSYATLNRRANQVAHYLLGLGVQPDDRVALCCERGVDMVVALLGILKAGAGYVPLDPAYPADRLAYMLGDSAPVALVTDSATLAQLAPALPVLTFGGVQLDGQPEHDPVVENLTPASLAYVIYTSGSTGQPKGVMVEHGNVARLFDATSASFNFGSSDCWTLFHSIAFDFTVWELWGALAHGGKLVVVPAHVARSPGDFYALLCREGVTVLNQTPSAFRQLIQAQDDQPHRLHTIVFGGEALDLRTLAPWIERNDPQTTRLVNMYGITEITVHATYRAITRADIVAGRGSVIGASLPDLQMYLLDGDLQPVPVGVTGELYIGGAGVARGYLNRAELTHERFIANPFDSAAGARLYRTGDLARRLLDGDIEYQGRNDFQVKIRGFRIELGEIEAKLAACDGVREAVVIAREDTPDDQRLVAYLIADAGAAPTAAALREQLLASLADYMVPSAFVTLAAYPLTTNGKLDTRALPAPDASALAVRAFAAPQGEVEQTIAAIWQALLGLEQVGRNDNFFELGGHSLLAVQLVARVRAELGVELPLRELFTDPTLVAVARAVAGAQQSAMTEITVVDRSRPLPLSWSQQRLWFLDRLDASASASYHLPSGLRLKGQLDQTALRATLDRIVARHENLRTTFSMQGGEPVQTIHPAASGFALQEQDLSALSGHEREYAMARVATIEASAPFDLGSGPLIRGRLLRMADDEHVLLVTMHHIISDGWSNGVLVQEVRSLYSAFVKGEPDPLAPLAIQYADYAAWQRSWLAGTMLDDQVGYWKRRLEGAPVLLDLPSDHARPVVRSYVGGSAPIALSAELSARLHAFGQRHGATLFMTLLSGWSALLARLAGQTDVVIGTSVANRGRREVEPLIGFFVNSLALRVQMDDDPTLAALVERVKADTLDAYAHQDLPFEQVVEAVKPPRSMSYSPLFQVLFSLNNTPDSGELQLPGLTLSGIGQASTSAQFDLALRMADIDGRLVGTLEYAADLYTQASAERMVRRFETALASMVGDDTLRLSELPIMDAAERQHLLVDVNRTDMPFPDAALIHQPFEAYAARNPQALAVVAGGASITYGELNRRANQLAHLLRARGVRPDSRVAICFERSVAMLVAILGVLKAGGAYVPLDPTNPEERLSYMLGDCAPVALLTQSALEDSLPALSLLPVIALDGRADMAQLARQPEHDPDPAQFGLGTHHLAYIIYTSGSTGQSKGVAVEHRSALNFWNVMFHSTHAGYAPGSRIALNAAYTFDMSLKGILQLLSGHALFVIPQDIRADAPAMLAYLEHHRIDAFDCTPSQLEILLAAGLLDNPAWQPGSVLIGGEPIADAMWNTLRNAPQVRFFNMYGPTEATVDATIGRIEAADETPHIGRPLGNARIYLLDAALQPVPAGASGEIWIGGAGVARGYLNREALTGERFVADPFDGTPGARMYKTGDLGRWLADGNLGYVGRNDFQVKIRGFRIELGEIEACLLACAGVREALVVAREDQQGDKRLVAYLVAPPDEAPSAVDLRRELAERLPDYMVPSAYVVLGAFPLNANGKLDRGALPAPDAAAAAAQQYEAPLGWHEITIAAIWQELIGLERVGRQDHFFDLGGHSLLAVQLVSRLHRECGVEIALRELFSHPVLCDFAAVIAGMAGAASTTLATLRAEGSQRPLFLVHSGTGEIGYARVLAAALDPQVPVHALSAHGFLAGETADASVERMAERYLGALRQVQPHGPYRLGGWSAGGTIACAMAHQLELDGEQVDYLGLIDTMAIYPPLPGGDAADDQAHALYALAPPGHPDLQAVLALRLAADDIDGMLAALQDAGLLPRDLSLATLHRYLSVRHAIAVAVRRYVPPQLAAPLTLYTARAEQRDDPILGWGLIARRTLQVRCFDTTHQDIVQPASAAALAHAIGVDLQLAAAATLSPTAPSLRALSKA